MCIRDSNTYRAPDGSYDFKLWKEMVYCDTPEMPAAFTSIKLWHESSRCKRNTPANTSSSVNASPRYPYPYPARTDGGCLLYTSQHNYSTNARITGAR